MATTFAGISVGGGGIGIKADDEVRTRDLELGKLALYQLSYVRVKLILRLARLPDVRAI
jgi:hypothetical protein